MRMEQILGPSEKSHEFINAKFSVYYNVGINGKIKGNLTLNSNYLIFNPSLDNAENIDKFSGAGTLFLTKLRDC